MSAEERIVMSVMEGGGVMAPTAKSVRDWVLLNPGPGQLVLFDGFSQFPELVPGDVYCVDKVRSVHTESDQIQLYDYDKAWYDSYLFSQYFEGDSFQHYKTSSPKHFKRRSIHEIGAPRNIRLRRLNWMRTPDRLQEIDLTEVEWYNYKSIGDDEKARNSISCKCCNGYKIINSDLDYPGILLDGTSTDTGRRYLSLDGSHRIQKLLYYGIKSTHFWVWHWEETLNYWEDGWA